MLDLSATSSGMVISGYIFASTKRFAKKDRHMKRFKVFHIIKIC